jgi:hypothetical protein
MRPGSQDGGLVITFIFVVMTIALLTVAGVFALAQMEKMQERQSGSLSAASVEAEQERATGLD